ncbi:hypothetical protein [Marivirga harenae]|uniref:hypothetical protein n=1 Tax=Marivirga harenae TaxID=2010992 RepID=UPI0026E0FD05|nr:hypothetical protein [Marivirga harenae]WKV11864.1 hypothetical protein Q3Y49_16810 [Marivirga harenae]|tara:strand:- start:42371 stop:42787 length:417 start_codon:yes stop_codon:yes gene_type:complete
MKLFYISLLVICFFTACTASTVNTNRIDVNVHNLAYSSLDIDAIDFSYNESKDFLLGIFQDNSSVSFNTLKFVVIDVKNESVVYKESIPNGKVKWISDYKVEIINPPGMVKSHSETLDDHISILNVKTAKKVKRGAAF